MRWGETIARLLFYFVVAIVAALFFTSCAGYNSDVRWNIHEERFEQANQSDVLKYNYTNQRWSFESPASNLNYNSLENEWQWSR